MKTKELIKLLKFAAVLAVVLVFSYIIHAKILENMGEALQYDSLTKAYLFNYCFTLAVSAALDKLKETHLSSLGFIFLGGSLVKFLLFFVFFYSDYNADGDMDRVEFFTFFVPYGLCLLAEIVFLTKTLNGMPVPESKSGAEQS